MLISLLLVRKVQTDPASNALLERRIKDVLQLHTAEHIYRDIIYIGETDKVFGIPMRNRQILFAIDIQVRAGINLDHGFELHTQRDHRGRTNISVRLPDAEIFSVDAREESIRQYFSSGYGVPITLIACYDQIMKSRTAIREDALRNGILQQAEAHAGLLIQSMTAGVADTNISFASYRPAYD
ncbi:hypothetical protein JCM12856_07420 [Spirochaeta dissipatitropha]